MAKNIAVSSDFTQNTCIQGSQRETLSIFLWKFCLVTFLEYITFIHFSRYSKFCPQIKLDSQNATAQAVFFWLSEKCPSLSFKLELRLPFLLRGISKNFSLNDIINYFATKYS